jgi:hypothetical protein
MHSEICLSRGAATVGVMGTGTCVVEECAWCAPASGRGGSRRLQDKRKTERWEHLDVWTPGNLYTPRGACATSCCYLLPVRLSSFEDALRPRLHFLLGLSTAEGVVDGSPRVSAVGVSASPASEGVCTHQPCTRESKYFPLLACTPRRAASLPTDNCPQPKEAQPLSQLDIRLI